MAEFKSIEEIVAMYPGWYSGRRARVSIPNMVGYGRKYSEAYLVWERAIGLFALQNSWMGDYCPFNWLAQYRCMNSYRITTQNDLRVEQWLDEPIDTAYSPLTAPQMVDPYLLLLV